MTRNMGEKNPGIKRPFFPLPNTDEIEDYICVKLSIPNTTDYRVSLLSCLTLMRYWFNWERDTEKRGAIVSRIWGEVIDNMAWDNACCGDKPQRQRILSDGTYEISYDNGETWEAAPPELDPRENSIVFKPLDISGSGELRCATAENVTESLKSQLQNQIDEINLGVSIVGLVAAALAVATIFMSGGTLAPLVTALAASTFGAGSAALAAAFTEEVWDEFKCVLFCLTPDDGNYSNDDIQAVKDEIDAQFVGIVVTVLWSYMDMYGAVGVTNMGRTGSATGDTCFECDCDDLWCKTFDFTASNGGWAENGGSYTALYYSGEGWGVAEELGTGNVAYSARNIGIYIDFGVSAYVTSMHFEYSAGNAENVGYILDDGMLYAFAPIISNPQGIPINTDTEGIGILIDRANPNTLTSRIVRITLRGTGENPFGADNCF